MKHMKPSELYPVLNRGDYADLFMEDSSFTTIKWEDGKIEELNTGTDTGCGLRYCCGDSVYFGTADSLALNVITDVSHRIGIGLPEQRNRPPVKPVISVSQPARINPDTVPIDKKIKLIEQVYRHIKSSGSEIAQIIIYYGERSKQTGIVTSEGAAVAEGRKYIITMISVVATKNNLLQTATEVYGGIGGYEIMDESKIMALGRAVAARACKKLYAPSAPVGEMPVIIAAQAGGTMIHEAIGHSLEADAVQKGISPVYVGKKGSMVASDLITVIDDPTLEGKRGSYHFDDEAVKSKPTILIENGELKNYLYDIRTAHKDSVDSNAHGRRQSYKERPIPRMSNTFIQPGNDDPRRIIGSIDQGLLVCKMGGGQVNTATGDFIFDVEEGYRIKDGSVHELVRGANLLGNGPDVLRSIDRVGNDIGWGIGTCGKDGQGVPVADAQPTIRIKKMLVGGS
ncbi:MAG: TldD/PmbA family protein [Elusimicrobia bacterium]|nr:TldD/PmbA family protein [Elusimicrobiota bacterium]MBD3411726.1 TldD/PmbA family protein [Elusimicrobiota bacterium]